MSANIHGMIESAKRALNNNNRAEAQQLLLKVIEYQEENEEAWLYLASAVDTDEEKRTCLENVLTLNPHNQVARRALTELDRQANRSDDLGDDLFSAAFGGAEDTSTLADASEDASGSDTSTGTSFDELFSSSPFDTGNSFSSSASDPFSGEFSANFDIEDTTGFESDTPAAPASPPPVPASAPKSSSSSLFDSSPVSPSEPEDDDEDDEMSLESYDNDTGYGYDDGDEYEDDEDEERDDSGDEEETSDIFSMIPDHIKPTRIPGTDEKLDTTLVAGIAVVGVLNVVMIVLLLVQLL